MADYTAIPSDDIITKTAEALKSHGFETHVVADAAAAKAAVLELIPEGSEVFTNTSQTVEAIGADAVLNSNAYDSVRDKVIALSADPAKKQQRIQLTAAPEYATGSAHAVTQDGAIFIASNTGSQYASEVFGASHVVLVVSAKKIVKDYDEAFARIEDHVYPLENERSKVAYGGPSTLRKILIYREGEPGRVQVILVKEDLGF